MRKRMLPARFSNYFHFFYHSLRLKVDSSYRVPLAMHIGLTAKCPHRCLYCNYADIERSDRLTGDNVEKILEDAYRLGTRRVNFTGGEPTTHPDFDRIIRFAHDRGFIVTVSTSGFQAQEHLEAFRLCNTILLSLEGPPGVHAKLCGDLSAREVSRAIEIFFRDGIRFWTTSLLTKLNIDQIDWIVEHARQHKSLANFSLLEATDEMGPDFHPSYGGIEGLLPEDAACRAALRRLIELKKAGAPIGSSLPYLEELLRWPDYRRLWNPAPSRLYQCLAARAACEISFDGNIYACGWTIGKAESLSVLDLGLPEAFRRLRPPTNCHSCASNCWLESNLIFNLHPRTIWNWVKAL